MPEKIEISRKPDLIKKRRKQGGKRPGSGRKKGTPNKLTFQLKEAAAAYGGEVLNALVALIRDSETPPATIVAACRELLDRGFGRPTIELESKLELSRMPSREEMEKTFLKVMAESRERQRQLLIDRGIIIEQSE